MPTVTLTRRWGSRKPGSKVEVDQTRADYLIGIGVAVAGAVETSGDPVASGDPTRRRPKTVRGNREGNRAEPAAGSPAVPSYGRKKPQTAKHVREEADPTERRLTSTRWDRQS